MQPDTVISLTLVAVGGTAVSVGTGALLFRERASFAGWGAPRVRLPRTRSSALAAFVVVALVAAHFALGMQTIEARGLTHVEAYVPGLDLPADVSEPPRRIAFGETVWWHWNSEPHPPGYFVLMWFATKALGTSLTAIRLPSLFFGCVSIWLVYVVGTRALRSRWGGVLAAALLALNGHHLRWALMARPYELALLLALLSTWLWLAVSSSRRPNATIELAYVAVTVFGLYVHVLFWTFLASQMLYTVATRRPGQPFASRTSYLQTLVVLFGSPMISHALSAGRRVQSGGSPSLAFAQEFLSFGFLFQPDVGAKVAVPVPLELALSAVAIVCVVLFVRDRSMRAERVDDVRSVPPRWVLVVLAAGFAAILLALAQQAWYQPGVVRVAAAAPIAIVAVHALLEAVRVPAWWPENGPFGDLSPVAVLPAATFLLTCAISLVQPAAVSRGLLFAVPLLLVVLAGGLLDLLRLRAWIGAAVLAFVVAASLGSVDWYRDFERSRDYRGLAEALVPALEDGDLIFVPKRDWRTTPLFYHLSGEHRRLVAEDYGARAAAAERVWVIKFRPPIDPRIADALGAFAPVARVDAYMASAILYRRAPGPAD